MKRLLNFLPVVFCSLLAFQTMAQSSTELVFKQPVLVSGTDKRTGAVYRFYNVRQGTDALLTIAAASETTQLINTLDVTTSGWDKAFQPEIGRSGTVRSNDSWWVRFNLKFVYSNTTTKRKLNKFYATAIDVDGDNSTLQEFVQMYTPDSVRYNPSTLLTQKTAINAGLAATTKTCYNLGPVKNYTNIDTAGTPVMVTYTFLNTDEINFVYGAKTASSSTTAGLRLNSLWFKAFDLSVNSALPVKNTSFVVTSENRNVSLQWSIIADGSAKEFVVEKSSDGITYQPVTVLPAVNGQAAYGYTDANVSSASGMLYYRILFVEQNDAGTYSTVKSVRLSKDAAASLRIYPNPVRATANVTVPDSWQNQPVSLALFNSAGVQVQAKNIARASQTESLNLSALAPGVYVVQAQCNGKALQMQVIKN